jgi:amino acid transporter
MESFEQNNTNGLRVTGATEMHWRQTAKWATFFAVLGFIGAGIYLLASFTILPVFQAMSSTGAFPLDISQWGWLVMLFMLAFVAALFFLSLYHIRFANGIPRAFNYQDQAAFEDAWRNLRNHFRLQGILTIAVIVIYVGAIVAIAMFSTGGF